MTAVFYVHMHNTSEELRDQVVGGRYVMSLTLSLAIGRFRRKLLWEFLAPGIRLGRLRPSQRYI